MTHHLPEFRIGEHVPSYGMVIAYGNSSFLDVDEQEQESLVVLFLLPAKGRRFNVANYAVVQYFSFDLSMAQIFANIVPAAEAYNEIGGFW